MCVEQGEQLRTSGAVVDLTCDTRGEWPRPTDCFMANAERRCVAENPAGAGERVEHASPSRCGERLDSTDQCRSLNILALRVRRQRGEHSARLFAIAPQCGEQSNEAKHVPIVTESVVFDRRGEHRLSLIPFAEL